MSTNRKEPIIGEFIKFYPIAFWIIWDQPQIDIDLQSLTKNRKSLIDYLLTVTISVEIYRELIGLNTHAMTKYSFSMTRWHTLQRKKEEKKEIVYDET